MRKKIPSAQPRSQCSNVGAEPTVLEGPVFLGRPFFFAVAGIVRQVVDRLIDRKRGNKWNFGRTNDFYVPLRVGPLLARIDQTSIALFLSTFYLSFYSFEWSPDRTKNDLPMGLAHCTHVCGIFQSLHMVQLKKRVVPFTNRVTSSTGQTAKFATKTKLLCKPRPRSNCRSICEWKANENTELVAEGPLIEENSFQSDHGQLPQQVDKRITSRWNPNHMD